MGSLAVLVMLLAASPSEHPCFLPLDQTAGWKHVVLPEAAPALAAPADVDQFRSSEPVLFLDSAPSLYAGAAPESPGRMGYHFRVPRDAHQLDIGFAEELRGAKVDAVLYADGFTFPLLSERRIGGSQLSLEWAVHGAQPFMTVIVSVHHHLREKPVVSTWRAKRLLDPGNDAVLPASFRAPRSLYYRHPGGGRRLLLCDTPDFAPRLTRWPESDNAVEVTLRPP